MELSYYGPEKALRRITFKSVEEGIDAILSICRDAHHHQDMSRNY